MISQIRYHIFCQWPRNIHNNLKFMSVLKKLVCGHSARNIARYPHFATRTLIRNQSAIPYLKARPTYGLNKILQVSCHRCIKQ